MTPAKRLIELQSRSDLNESEKDELNMLLEQKRLCDEHDNNWNAILSKPRYFDIDSKPMSLWDWRSCFDDEEYKKIGKDTVGDYFISTVWLGLKTSLLRDKLFETMIFNEKNDEENVFCDYIERYSTKEQALEGHLRAVEMVRRILNEKLQRKN